MTKFVLNFATGSVKFKFTTTGAQALHQALLSLMDRLKQASSSPKHPQDPLDYRYATEDITLEVFCNPNIWPSPHAARVLVTLKSDLIRLSTEADLPQVMDDLSQYLETV